MKKLLLITASLAIILSACQKSETLKSDTSFLPGNWVRTKFVDTLYSNGKYAGSNSFDVSLNKNTIVFGANGAGSSTYRGDLTYSEAGYTLFYNSIPETTWSIKSVTANSFILRAGNSDNSLVYTDYYSKQ